MGDSAGETHGVVGDSSDVTLSEVEAIFGGVCDVERVEDWDVVIGKRLVVVGFRFQLDVAKLLQLDRSQDSVSHLKSMRL